MMRVVLLLAFVLGLGAASEPGTLPAPQPLPPELLATNLPLTELEATPPNAGQPTPGEAPQPSYQPDRELIGQITEVAVVSAVNAAMDSMVPAVEALSSRLGAVEQLLSTQAETAREQSRSLQDQARLLQDQAQASRDQAQASAEQTRILDEQSRRSTQTILLVVGCFATALLLGVLIGALILARAVQRVSEVVVSALPPSRQLSAGSSLALAESHGLDSAAPTPVDQVTGRFLSAIDRLEKRILELEHAAHPGATGGEGGSPGNGTGNGAPLEFSVSALHEKQYGPPGGSIPTETHPDPVQIWLGKGQALLSLGQMDEALVCFDKALELSPDHADAHVKRGMVLEKLEKMEAALASYDQAIAADESFTLAYLYKGAVCNRLQRYREALDCYESALKCEQKLAGT